MFHDSFITRGARGGEDAADELLAALQHHVREMTGEPGGMDILVRAFANVTGLGGSLVRDGRLKDAGQLRAFASGFSSRQPFFDFVDVGAGKERADLKLRGGIQFFLESFQCKHLVLACGHDSGYAPFLGQFVGDKQVAARVTLLEGSPFPAAIRDLGLKKTQFNSLFNNIITPPSAPALGKGYHNPQLKITPPSAPGLGKGYYNPHGKVTPSSVLGSGKGHHNLQVQTDRLGPVLTDQAGRRVDKMLSVSQAVADRLKKGRLCFHLFLRGECAMPKCECNHVHRLLTADEFDALWWLARQGRCFKSRKAEAHDSNEYDCSDGTCIYGHRMGIPSEDLR